VSGLDTGTEEGSCHGAGLDGVLGLDTGGEEDSDLGAGRNTVPGLDIGAEEDSVWTKAQQMLSSTYLL
jgi:hypothetical protein